MLWLIATVGNAADGLDWRQLAPLPDPLGVAGPFAGHSGGGLLVAGGAHFPERMPWDGGTKVWTDRVWFLASKQGAWKPGGKLPRPLAYGISAGYRGKVWCVGGADAQQHYREVFSLEWREDGLVTTPASPLPVPLAYAAGAVSEEGTLFVACGAETPGEKVASNRVFSATLGGPTLHWEELPPLPAQPRLLPVAAASGGRFYIFGGAALVETNGETSRQYLRDCWSYSRAEGWRRRADLPEPALAAASPAPLVQGDLWILGGDDGVLKGFKPPEKHPGFPGAIYRYTPGTDTWQASGRVPAPRVTLPSIEWDGDIVLPSGEVRPGVRSNQVWSFSKSSPLFR
jgi:N-acetylneuraminic acid mutarotase